MLFLCHGYGEYLAAPQWDLVGKFFAQNGILAFGHDHVGHGHTSGERVQGIVSFAEDYCFPVAAHCRARVKMEGDGNLPLFLSGHSMGGLIALLTADLAPKDLFRGVLVVGPAIEVDPKMASSFNIFMAKALSGICPSLQVTGMYMEIFIGKILCEKHVSCQPGVDEDGITSNKEWLERLKADKMNWHGGLKIKQGLLGLNVCGSK